MAENPESIEARRLAAAAKLYKIPGVKKVTWGVRDRNKMLQDEAVFRVYVDLKKPAASLSPEEMVPATIDGFPTDVHTYFEEQASASFSTPNVKPGKEITPFVFNSPSSGGGTAGCIVMKDGHRMILSNEHVIESRSGLNDVYQPKYCSFAGINCRKPAAAAVAGGNMLLVPHHGREYWVDAALAQLYDYTTCDNILPWGPAITQIRDISDDPVIEGVPGTEDGTPVNTYQVKKHGSVTGTTSGHISDFHEYVFDSVTLTTHTEYKLYVQPDTLNNYDVTYVISTQESTPLPTIVSLFSTTFVTAEIVNAAERKMRFHGSIFLNKGDSGSAMVDDTNKLTGLMCMGTFKNILIVEDGIDRDFPIPTGRGIACFIIPVFNFLGLNQATALAIPAGGSSGALLEMPVEVHEDDPEAEASLSLLRDRIRQYPMGRELLDELQPLLPEMVHAVHHFRPAKVLWQRTKGPGFVTGFLSAAKEGHDHFVTEVEGITLVEMLSRMGDLFAHHGSIQLKAFVQKHRSEVLRMAGDCRSFSDLIHFFSRIPIPQ